MHRSLWDPHFVCGYHHYADETCADGRAWVARECLGNFMAWVATEALFQAPLRVLATRETALGLAMRMGIFGVYCHGRTSESK